MYIFSLYQSLLQTRAHMCNILFIVFDILEIKITHEDSDQSRNVWKYVTFWAIVSGP